MTDITMCEFIDEHKFKGAVPYVVGFSAALASATAIALFLPVIALVRKLRIYIPYSIGGIKVRYRYANTDENASPSQGQAEPPKPEASQEEVPTSVRVNKSEEFCKVDTPLLIRAKLHTQNPASYGAADRYQNFGSSSAVIDTINILVNANNTYYAIMIFLIITFVLHCAMFVLDITLRKVEYSYLLSAFEEAKNAINASAATVAPLTSVVNMFKQVSKPCVPYPTMLLFQNYLLLYGVFLTVRNYLYPRRFASCLCLLLLLVCTNYFGLFNMYLHYGKV